MSENILNNILNICRDNDIPSETSFPLRNLTTFRIGGTADILIKPVNIEQSVLIQDLVRRLGIGLFILGGGSNLLISDDGIRDVVLHLCYPEKIDIRESNREKIIIRIPASMKSAAAAKKISRLGYSGLEFLTTIPGTLGGAIVQNAGCYGSDISEIILTTTVSRNDTVQVLTKAEMEFSYRSSIFKKDPGFLIHDAEFILTKGDINQINRKIEEFRDNRIKSQPANRKSAGSIFKNPIFENEKGKHKAWYYIQECGLKGFSIGDAVISLDHANFILNEGNATSNDVYQLVKFIQTRVYEKFNVQLDPEIIFVGKF